mmetsp:Transcript_36228/g.26380  ORF Transcript_36228/g.26380 Transcript_36228/m.26380 type:complete len:142 (+) Transcript_36228:769-1194(+)|eukprot:CAMPEP_0116878704 /NCGR_PEP_ID=MMETSP0463-20121206/10449_1 /TAXON_ID=181622 /ORGANISM="Strombidinopsis sp, Strain SopsisLIS2011" /LENGTH=141 /DNA_ID=CAMNT_0004527181 /DNA_START=1199 /DNA_END=1624 /DNA_ORIENTATION=-
MKYAQADFNMKEYMTPEEWFGEKFNLGMDFPTIIYVFAGDFKLTEAAACYLYLGARHCPDLTASNDPKCRGYARMLENAAVNECANAIFGKFQNSEDKDGLAQEALEKIKPIEKYLKGKKYLGGDSLTYVDFMFFEGLNRL